MLPTLIARARSLWLAIRRRTGVESEASDEFRAPVEHRTDDLIRYGVEPAEATRQARLEFGNPEHHKLGPREPRRLRSLASLRVSRLDFKLGFRMLRKYPGLTVIGGLAMAFAIWVGAVAFEVVTQVLRPTLPLPDGGRIVGINTWDAATSRLDGRVLHDVARWQSEVKSIVDLGVFRSAQRNLITGDGLSEPLDVVEISPSAFRVTRVTPLLGRTLVDSDATPGAAPVVVIGHDLWQQRLGADPNVAGRTVRLGRAQYTVVGVMPPKYAFPWTSNLWIPFQLDASDVAPRRGPAVRVFGRLAPGASYDDANAEIRTIGGRMARELRETHEHLRPEVLPYAQSLIILPLSTKAALASMNIPALMLLVLLCGNVALLMFARAASREREMIVRTALGATRARLIMQLFAEALVLGTVAAVVGLAGAGRGLAWLMHTVRMHVMDGDEFPFWFSSQLSSTTILYAAILTLLAAVIAGVVPAIKVTRGMGSRIQQASAGAGGMRFGGIWTAVIVAQIAVTMAFPAFTFFLRGDEKTARELDPGIRAHEYLGVRLELDREPPPGAPMDTSRDAWLERYRTSWEELERRLSATGVVAGVTFAEALPLMPHDFQRIEVNEGGAAPRPPAALEGWRVNVTRVATNFFDVMEAPILAGRRFSAVDLEANTRSVIVNQSFVRRVLGDRNAIGRRIRPISEEQSMVVLPVAERGPWHEIVGVVPDMAVAGPWNPIGVYHPARVEDLIPAQVAVHVRGDAESFTPRLRAIASEVDPTLRLYDIRPVSAMRAAEIASLRVGSRLLLGVSLIALLLSLAGIYAVMSFTVARRTREIGIRIALGASGLGVITGIFRQPLIQVTSGVAAGVVLLCTLLVIGDSGPLPWKDWGNFAVYGVGMLGVCLLACIVPTVRALRVQPTEALRAEG